MTRPQYHFQQGVGLIEILVTIVILSVGLLGIVSMQTQALKNNNSALEHSIAVMQSYSITEAMLIARTAAIEGDFNLAIDEEPTTAIISEPQNSSEHQQKNLFAQTSLIEWRTSLRALLGETATGSVACNGKKCNIIVQWDDGRTTAGKSVQNIHVDIHL